MQRFQHLLIDLTLDGQDESLLRWAQHIGDLSGSKKITVVHTWETNDIPAKVKEKYPWLVMPGAETLQKRLDDLKQSQFSIDWQARSDWELIEGDRIQAILKKARDVSADLIITPRQTNADGTEKYASRLARKSPCSVFCVETSKPQDYKKILVPVDFSDHSARALDFGCALARAAEIGHVDVLRSYGIPYGQHKAMISREEFAAEYETYESERLDKFINELKPTDIELNPVVFESMVAAYGITNYSRHHEVDVVVLGSRGAHAVSALLLGSTTEAIINDVPSSVLVIKPKGTGLSLLNSLLGE